MDARDQDLPTAPPPVVSRRSFMTGAAAAALAAASGVGLSWSRWESLWVRPGALLDLDLSIDRYYFGGLTYASRAEVLDALGAAGDGAPIVIGPYAVPGAPEQVTNGAFSEGVSGWTAGAAGNGAAAIAVVDGRLRMDGNGADFPNVRQALGLVRGHAYRVRAAGRMLSISAAAVTVATTPDFWQADIPNWALDDTWQERESTFSAAADTVYVGGRFIQSASTGSAEYGGFSVREVLPFPGFRQGGFAVIVSGVSAEAADDQVIFQADDGSLTHPYPTPSEANRVRLVWSAERHIRLLVTFAGAEVVNLDLGPVAAGSPFEVVVSAQDGGFAGAIVGRPSQVVRVDGLPGIAVLRIGRGHAGNAWAGTLHRITLFPHALEEGQFYAAAGDAGSVAAWGDSLTAGGYPWIAAGLFDPPRAVAGQGVGGQSSTAIAARQGALPIRVSVVDDTIPATGPVSVAALHVAGIDALREPRAAPINDQGPAAFQGILQGVHGTLIRVDDSTYQFLRDAGGVAVASPPLSSFEPDMAAALRSRIQWLWLGTNGAAPGRSRLGDIAAVVERIGHSRYLVASNIAGTMHDAAAVAEIAALNTALATTYGVRYVDLAAALREGSDGSPEDLADIAAGWTPRSLRVDAVHLNDAGNAIVAEAFVARTLAMGW